MRHRRSPKGPTSFDQWLRLERNALQDQRLLAHARRFKAIMCQNSGSLRLPASGLFSMMLQTISASPLGRIFDTQRLFLRRHAPGRNYQKKA